MTRPGIEPRSPGPLVNTLTPRPMSGKKTNIKHNKNDIKNLNHQVVYKIITFKLNMILLNCYHH